VDCRRDQAETRQYLIKLRVCELRLKLKNTVYGLLAMDRPRLQRIIIGEEADHGHIDEQGPIVSVVKYTRYRNIVVHMIRWICQHYQSWKHCKFFAIYRFERHHPINQLMYKLGCTSGKCAGAR
jgi:hypothetical protein